MGLLSQAGRAKSQPRPFSRCPVTDNFQERVLCFKSAPHHQRLEVMQNKILFHKELGPVIRPYLPYSSPLMNTHINALPCFTQSSLLYPKRTPVLVN